MADSVSQTTRTSLMDQLGASFKSVLFGLLLFAGSFVLLFWNEGRAVSTAKSLSEGSHVVASVEPTPVDPANEGKLIHIRGKADTTATPRDTTFNVAAQALKLIRTAEMYQWIEHQTSRTHKNIGGSKETTTTYTYVQQWSEQHIDSGKFKEPTNHTNPPKNVESQTFVAPDIKVGAFELSSTLIDKIHNPQPLETAPGGQGNPTNGYKQDGATFYRGENSAQPAIGDMRVTFSVIKPQDVSIIAQQSGTRLRGYATKAGPTLEMLEPGDHSAPEMFKEARDQNAKMTWMLRLVGFLAMWFGLMMVVNPLQVLADMVPFLGNIAGTGLALSAALVALPLSLITIAAAWLLFRPLMSVGLMAAGLAVAYLLVNRLNARDQNPASTTPT